MLYETAGTTGGANLYAYCLNNPVMYTDSDGHFLDFILDLIFIVYDIFECIANPSAENFGYLLADVGALFIPGVTGVGAALRIANRADKALDISKAANKLDNILLHPQSIANAKLGNPTWGTFRQRVWKNEARLNPQAYGKQVDRMLLGKAPQINGKSMQLHHVLGKSDFYNVVKLTNTQHTLFHKTFGYRQNALWNLNNIISILY